MKKKQQQSGFTLIELLLYIAISAVMLLAISFFLFALLESRIKNQSIAEVEQQGLEGMQIITQAVRNSEAVTSPAQWASASVLTLDVIASSDDPTVFDVSGGSLRITEGSKAAVPLTNSLVVVSGLTFQNLSKTNTPGIVRVQFTVARVNPSGRNEYSFSKTFTGSATLRQP